jgi:hypothetical protein
MGSAPRLPVKNTNDAASRLALGVGDARTQEAAIGKLFLKLYRMM